MLLRTVSDEVIGDGTRKAFRIECRIHRRPLGSLRDPLEKPENHHTIIIEIKDNKQSQHRLQGDGGG